MKRRLNPLVAAFLAAASVALALPATAQADGVGRHHASPGHDHMRGEMRHGEMRGGMRGGMRMLRGLDLSEEQRDAMFKIFHEQAPVVRERAKAAREAREELRKLSASPEFDRNRARELADAAARAQADLALMRAESRSKVIALLTPEQRAKLDEARERRKERRR